MPIRMTARQASKLTGEKPRSKYGARRTEYDGVMYDSKREAQYAAELHLQKRAGVVQAWERQVKLPLHVDTGWRDIKRGDAIVGNYVVDFVIVQDRGRRYVDVKGFDTPLSKWKRKHAEAEYGIKIEIVK